MSISLETVAKGLIIVGLVQRYGFIKVGLGILALSLVSQLLVALLTSYKLNQLKKQMPRYR